MTLHEGFEVTYEVTRSQLWTAYERGQASRVLEVGAGRQPSDNLPLALAWLSGWHDSYLMDRAQAEKVYNAETQELSGTPGVSPKLVAPEL